LFIQLRQEYTVLAPEEELRWQPDDVNQSMVSRGGGGGAAGEKEENGSTAQHSQAPHSAIDNSRFQMLNDKLEMQILLQEIRQALPALEEEAKRWEEIAGRETKKSQRQAKANASLKKAGDNSHEISALYKESHRLEREIEDYLDQILRMKTDRTVNLEREKKANDQLTNEIALLRKELHQLQNEEMSLEAMVINLKCQHLVEGKRGENIVKEFVEVRERVSQLHDGLGWQTELYKSLAGK
jgi:chromosome segregation ATPase